MASRSTVMTQFLSFLSVGILATLLQYLLAAVLVLAAGLPVVLASTMGFLLSACFNYWANARFTFAAQGSAARHRPQQLRFAAMVGLGCAVNAVLLRGVLAWGLHPVASQLVATAGVLACNFALGRVWVFHRR